MNKRIEELRTHLQMSQEEFGRKINISRGAVSMLETGRRGITDRVVNDICREFSINELWLKTGEGSMFSNSTDNILSEVESQYKLDELDKRIIMEYIKMNEFQRKVIKDYILNIVNTLDK